MMNLYKGRRRELISAAILYLLGALVTALAPDLPVMVTGRFVFGIGIGLVSIQCFFQHKTILGSFFFKK